MNDLLKTRLSDLLFETSQEVTTEEMQNAYKHFTEQIIAISQSEQSYHEIFERFRFIHFGNKVAHVFDLFTPGQQNKVFGIVATQNIEAAFAESQNLLIPEFNRLSAKIY